jgi:hypothetical protein
VSIENAMCCANLQSDSLYQRPQPTLPEASVSGAAMRGSSRFICDLNQNKVKKFLEKLHICHS